MTDGVDFPAVANVLEMRNRLQMMTRQTLRKVGQFLNFVLNDQVHWTVALGLVAGFVASRAGLIPSVLGNGSFLILISGLVTIWPYIGLWLAVAVAWLGFPSGFVDVGILRVTLAIACLARLSYRKKFSVIRLSLVGFLFMTILVESFHDDAFDLFGNAVQFSILNLVLLALAISYSDIQPKHLLIFLEGFGGVHALYAVGNEAVRSDRTSMVLGLNANGVGFICAVALVSSICLSRATKHFGTRLCHLFVAALTFVGIAITASFGAYLTALVGCAAIVLSQTSSRRKIVLLLGLTMTVILVFRFQTEVWSSLRVTRRTGADFSESRFSRFGAATNAVSVWRSSPILGTGLGSLSQSSSTGLAAHNVWLSILAEQGVLAAAILVYIVRRFARALKLIPELRLLVPILVMYLVSSVVIEWQWGVSIGLGFWLATGIAASFESRLDQFHVGPRGRSPLEKFDIVSSQTSSGVKHKI